MFNRQHAEKRETVTIIFEEKEMKVPADISVSAAVLSMGTCHSRISPLSETRRGPYCQIGVCFECLMEIDGIPNRQACMTQVREGMRIRCQTGYGDLIS